MHIVYCLPTGFRNRVFSHYLDHVREHIKKPVVEEFMKGWIGFFQEAHRRS